jgi:hypothetical protein
MADRAKRLSELPAATSVAGDALMVVVDTPSGTANTKQITVSNLLSNSANVRATSIKGTTAPATANTTGVAGEIRYDSSYVYICVATNTWKRASLSTW